MTNARDKANIPVLNFQSKGIDDNADATAITIDSSERIGIGTASPTSKLSIEANSPDIMFTDTSGGTDSKKWRVYGLDDNFNIGCRNDANNSGQTALRIHRTANNIDSLRFFTSGSERARIDSGGQFRINNSSSTGHGSIYNLIVGNESSGGDAGVLVVTPNSENAYYGFGDSGGVPCSLNYNHNHNFLRTYVNGSEAMRIISDGSVGFGESSPLAKIHIKNGDSGVSPHALANELFIENNGDVGITLGSSTSGSANIMFGDSGDPNRGRIRYHHNGDYMEFGTAGGNEKLVITSAGNVGIGVSNPDRPLVVDGGSHSTVLRVQNNSPHYADLIANTSGVTLRTVGSYPLILNTNQTERMRILSGGQILMRATSTSLTNATQIVYHPGSSEYGIRINSTGTSGTQYHLSFDRGQTQAGYITSNSATTIAVNNSSDERLKENIENSGSALQDIKDLKVRQFDWKNNIDTHRDFGFVAQELHSIIPEAVSVGSDELDDNGKPKQSWGVDYSHIVPRLVKAVQEQQTKIETLEAEITALKNQP